MTNKDYKKLIYPNPLTPQFLKYLAENNIVIYENDEWLVIENCKYHTKENPHFTAFTKQPLTPENCHLDNLDKIIIFMEWQNFYIYINAKKDRSIERFHIHICREKPKQ
jgi:hypothetical protein